MPSYLILLKNGSTNSKCVNYTTYSKVKTD